jgi:CheY-like chemotaxis protein
MKRPSQTTAKIHRVLICEDNLDQLHTFALLLKEMGHTVDFAINGYVAYDAIRRFRPDTVVLDLGLPGATGFEVAQQIRKDPELRGIRLIAVTAYSDESYRKRAEELGFDAYYVKPVDPKLIYEMFGDSKDAFTR